MNLINKLKDFFKSDKCKQLEQKINLKDIDQTIPKEDFFKIVKTIYNFNTGYCTIILNDGEVLEVNIDSSTYDSLRDCKSRDCLISLINIKEKSDKFIEEIEKSEDFFKSQVNNLIDILKDNPDFDIVENRVYLKGVKSIEVPSSIVAEFIRLLSEIDENLDMPYGLDYLYKEGDLGEEYNSLLMFTYKLLLNPLQDSRNQLLTFIKENDVRITQYGNLVLYRRCWEGNSSNDLVKFVSTEYLKVKAWKKSPKNYTVLEDNGTYYLGKIDSEDDGQAISLGNLAELYQKLPELQKEGKQYYSDHGKMKIVLGDIYKIDDSAVELDAGICAAGGLHAACVNYDYTCYGDTPLVVLVNPSKTITVPTHDVGKMRVSEMFIVGINHQPHGEHVSESTVHQFDENYHNYSLEELKNALAEKSVSNMSISDAISDLSLKEVSNISDILNNRLITI